MITNTTAAGAPTNIINAEQPQQVYFGPASTAQTSQTFTVDQAPFFLSAFGLGSDDVITVQQIMGPGSGTAVADFAPVAGAVTLNVNRTKLRIDYPGRYQLVHTGSSSLGTFIVTGGVAALSSDSIAGIAEALYTAFTNLKGSVIGTAPIVVTGAGTVGNPYVVSISTTPGGSPPNFVEITVDAPLAITGNGTSGTPYHITAPDIKIDPSTGLAIGDGATSSNAQGIAIGTNAEAGTNNIAIGANAGAGSTGVQGTFVGSGAGDVSTGDYITAFGVNAGDGETHSNVLLLGGDNGGSAPSVNATLDNQIVLGNSDQTQLVTAGSIIQAGAISASDERLKKNIESEFEALETLDKLSPVTFMWDRAAIEVAKVPMNEDEYGKLQHGLIAQEVEEYLPELVENIDRGAGPYKFVRYERVISILVAAIQELHLKMKALEEK